jgi:dipeptidyl aminopeptidase/acylaminoacyl peptidase
MKGHAAWEARFRAPGVSLVAIALGKRGRAVVGLDVAGVPQLHAWEGGDRPLRQLTDRADGYPWGTPLSISPDGEWAAVFEDVGGNELGTWVRLPLTGGPASAIEAGLGPGESSSLVIDRTARLVAFDVHADNATVIHLVDVASRERVRSRRALPSEGFIRPTCFLDSGALALVRSRPDGSAAMHVHDVVSGEELGRLDRPGITFIAWHASPIPGDDRLLASSNETGFRRPFLWDPATGRREDLGLEGFDGDVRPVNWSPDGRSVLLWQASDARGQLYVHDLADRVTRPLQVPAGVLGALPFDFAMGFLSDTEVLARWEDADHPPTLLRIPIDGRPAIVALPNAPVPRGRPWRSVTFPSADGTIIQGWLAQPMGEGPFPAVVDVPGGPTLVQGDGFQPLLQAFVDHGFAVLSVNYRGSTTFGRAFQEAINGGAGRLEVEDVVAGRDWLVGAGIAEPDAVLVEGLSYGGYLSLLAVGSYPDRWAGAIASIAVGDSIASWEDTGDALRALDVMTFGGSPEAVPESWRRGSPITYAPDITAPVLVFNGRNDARCPARQMERYEARLRELGKAIEVVWFDGGHLGGDADRLIDQARRSLEFAGKAVGRGR